MKRNLEAIICCAGIILLFFVIPAAFEAHMEQTLGDFYVKFMVLPMTMAGVIILNVIGIFKKVKGKI